MCELGGTGKVSGGPAGRRDNGSRAPAACVGDLPSLARSYDVIRKEYAVETEGTKRPQRVEATSILRAVSSAAFDGASTRVSTRRQGAMPTSLSPGAANG